MEDIQYITRYLVYVFLFEKSGSIQRYKILFDLQAILTNKKCIKSNQVLL